MVLFLCIQGDTLVRHLYFWNNSIRLCAKSIHIKHIECKILRSTCLIHQVVRCETIYPVYTAKQMVIKTQLLQLKC